MANNFRKRFLMNLGVSSGIVLVLIIVTSLIGSDMDRRANLILKLRQDIAFRNNAIASFVLLKEEARRAQEYRDILENLLPTQDELIALPRQIRSLASANKVTFSFSFGEQVRAAAGTAGSIGLDMTVTGKFADFLAFLSALEASNYFINFSALDVAQTEGGSNSKLTGRVFSRD